MFCSTEKYLFGKYKCSRDEVVFFSNLVSVVVALITVYGEGNFFPALALVGTHPTLVLHVLATVLCGYASVMTILWSVQEFGALTSELTKTTRRVMSIAFSLYLFPEHIPFASGLGFALAMGAWIYWPVSKYLFPKHVVAGFNQNVAHDTQQN